MNQLNEPVPNRQCGETETMSHIKGLTERLQDMWPHLRPFVQNPRLVGNWIEEHHPWLGRQFLSAASNLSDPYVAGMGLSILVFAPVTIEVAMPNRWRNRGGGGSVHAGALATLAEFTSRVFWERHLSLSLHEMRVGQIVSRFLRETESDTRAVFHFDENEREAVFYRLRAEGRVFVPCEVAIYDSVGRLVCETTVEWCLTRPKSLPGAK